MAVFKVTSYTKSRGGAKASIRYIQSRPGREGKRVERQLFGADGVMSREQACRLIDEAKRGALFYRLVISPDPRREDSRRDLGLWEMTQKTMQTLEERFNQKVVWVASAHDDHTPHRHVHVVAVLKRRLYVRDLKFLRQAATRTALLQRQELDLTLASGRRRGLGARPPAQKRHTRLGTTSRVTAQTLRRRPVNAPNPFNRHLCTCPYCLTEHIKRLETKSHRCKNCQRLLHRQPKLNLSRKEDGWER